MLTVNDQGQLAPIEEPMTPYRACSIAEGFSGEDHTEEEVLQAWVFLIKTGMCWTLQGWYGRTAIGLIESGYISPEGEVLM